MLGERGGKNKSVIGFNVSFLIISLTLSIDKINQLLKFFNACIDFFKTKVLFIVSISRAMFQSR